MARKNSKCPYCGAGLDLSRAVNGIVKCEYCDSEIDMSPPQKSAPAAPPPLRTVLTDAEFKEAMLAWKKVMKKHALLELAMSATMGFCLSLDIDGLAFLILLVTGFYSFAVPGIISGKYPTRDLNNKPSGCGAYIVGFIILSAAFWVGIMFGAMLGTLLNQ